MQYLQEVWEHPVGGNELAHILNSLCDKKKMTEIKVDENNTPLKENE